MLTNARTGKCVTVVSSGLEQRQCYGVDSKRWTLLANGLVKNPWTNQCWKTTSSTSGTQIMLAACPSSGTPEASMIWSNPTGELTCP